MTHIGAKFLKTAQFWDVVSGKVVGLLATVIFERLEA